MIGGITVANKQSLHSWKRLVIYGPHDVRWSKEIANSLLTVERICPKARLFVKEQFKYKIIKNRFDEPLYRHFDIITQKQLNQWIENHFPDLL